MTRPDPKPGQTVRGTVRANRLAKQFPVHRPHGPTTLHEALSRGLGTRSHGEGFWAVRDVDLRVAPGRSLGLIGSNGAGKSTLLKLLGGVLRADRGSVEVGGRIGALFDLGAGFHPDLTGAENVIVGAVVGGLTRAEARTAFDEIVAFAELQDFIDNPLRTYSDGMRMRLAFAVAIHTRPHVLLIDEVLAVGDLAFQRKCVDRIRSFQQAGSTLILASHQMGLVDELCDRVIWLRRGRVAARGPAPSVVRQYEESVDGGVEDERGRKTGGRP